MRSGSAFGVHSRDGVEVPETSWLLEAASAEPLEDERREAELLAYAHRQATRWGAGRFALELRRRDEEDRRQRAAKRWTPDRRAEVQPDPSLAAATQGPVLADVLERVVGPARAELDLKPAMRHPEVPRPPASEPESGSRRRRRRRAERVAPEPVSTVTAQQAARMSPGARRLYGIPDPPNRRGL